jgi:microcystin-dependent protein
MGTTAKYAIPYPELTDPPDGPTQMKNLAERVDIVVGLAFPVGGIIMWSGTLATVPVGWALCNGANGTPDLRGRFIVGASVDSGGTNTGASYNKGATGGADSTLLTTAHLPAHNHTMAAAGTHDHAGYQRALYQDGGTSNALAIQSASGVVTATNAMADNGSHSHTINSSPAATQQVPTRPLFFALAYIQKIS